MNKPKLLISGTESSIEIVTMVRSELKNIYDRSIIDKIVSKMFNEKSHIQKLCILEKYFEITYNI